jgi:formamidopyrimidine-DNA glycosylase
VPELPEVEIAARNLRRWAEGRRIERVSTDARAARIFRPADRVAFARALAGARLVAVDRRGKHLLATLEDRRGRPVGLWSHLGMTGKWVRRARGEEVPAHARVTLLLDDGHALHYVDPRLFGRQRLVPGAAFSAVPEIGALGPDPVQDGVDPARLGARLAATRRAVKVALLDQAVLAGVGNIHASESLFAARIDPRRRGASLSGAEVRAIARAIAASLRRGIESQDGPEIAYVEEPGAPNPFRVYARDGERCPRCRDAEIRRIVQAQRSTFFCPACQGAGTPPRPRRAKRRA